MEGASEASASMLETLNGLVTLEFPERLAWLRKEKSLTQKALAEAVGITSPSFAATSPAPRSRPWTS